LQFAHSVSNILEALLGLEIKNQQTRHQKEQNENDGNRKIVHHMASFALKQGVACYAKPENAARQV